MKQPIQPLYKDKDGKPRFLSNKIVEHLLMLCKANGLCDLCKLSMLDFSNEDREQFAQLIGYSLNGFSELDFVSNETYSAAYKIYESGLTEEQARLEYQSETIDAVKSTVKDLNEILGKDDE